MLNQAFLKQIAAAVIAGLVVHQVVNRSNKAAN